jgi:phospholipid/cholesterol/gamma-HCH transport system substrate-binding protein
MQINLDPGRPPAPVLPPGATIGAGRSSSPVPLSDLLSTLDSDTRDFVTSMLASFEQGTKGRGPDIRDALRALGPTTAQLHQITAALAQRRVDLANLVHNLAIVTRAASQDGQLASMVSAGDATLNALAAQDAPLRQSIADLPGTLVTAQQTLGNAATFANQLGPTVSALLPAVARLPATLADLGDFSRVAASGLAQQIRPLVREAQPLIRDLGPATSRLEALAPDMRSVFKVLNYFFNELGYNPGGNDQGFLFWASWFFHNGSSTFSLADAHGSLGGASFYLTCSQLANPLGTVTKLIAITTGIASLCP